MSTCVSNHIRVSSCALMLGWLCLLTLSSGCCSTDRGLRAVLEGMQVGPVDFTNAPFAAVIEVVNDALGASRKPGTPRVLVMSDEWIRRTDSLKGFESYADELITAFVQSHLKTNMPLLNVTISICEPVSAWEFLNIVGSLQEQPLEIVVGGDLAILRRPPSYECVAYFVTDPRLREREGGDYSHIVPFIVDDMLTRWIPQARVLLVVADPALHDFCGQTGKVTGFRDAVGAFGGNPPSIYRSQISEPKSKTGHRVVVPGPATSPVKLP